MATCKNCLHLEACKQWYTKLLDKYHDCCDLFKDRSMIVELPCKIGQKVYTIPRSAIREWTVCGVWVSADEKCSYAHIYWEKKGHRMESRAANFYYDLGKTVFLTCEEAEAALAEMRGDGNV